MRVNVDALTLQEDDFGEEGKKAQEPYFLYVILLFLAIVLLEVLAVIILVRVFGKFDIERDGPAKTMVVLGSGTRGMARAPAYCTCMHVLHPCPCTA